MPASTLQHILQENYIIAKIHGQKGALLSPRQLYSLTEFRTLSEIIGALSEGPYGKELSRLRAESSSIETERTILLGFSRTLRTLVSSSQGSERVFLRQFIRRFEANDLSALILSKALGKTWEEFLVTRQPITASKEARLHHVYSLDDLQSIIALAGDRELKARTQGFSMTSMDGSNSSLLRDIITGWGEERFYKYVIRQLSGADKSLCSPIAGSSIDFSNLTLILRSKLIGTTNPRDHLIHSSWKLDSRTVEQLLASQDVPQALDALSSHHYYGRILSGARQRFEDSKSLSFLEIVFRKYQLKLSKRVFLGFPYSLATILAFLVFKENEAMNLSAVLTGLEASLQQGDVRSLLALAD